jgi:hypothetical protein
MAVSFDKGIRTTNIPKLNTARSRILLETTREKEEEENHTAMVLTSKEAILASKGESKIGT